MGVDQVIRIFSQLAECSSVRDLGDVMHEIVGTHFPNSSITIYELIPARIVDDSQRANVIYKNSRTLEVEGRVEEHETFHDVFSKKEKSSVAHSETEAERVIPIVLSDKNISHMVSLKHQDAYASPAQTLDRIVDVFASLFKTVHEKNYDPLTRVLNRQAFEDACLELEYFNKATTLQNINPFRVVAILDIDNFKSINDRFGHAIGDEVLVLFCQVIASVIRDEDKLFRYGGEEFVVFLRGRELPNAKAILERFRRAIADRVFPQVGNITVSIGFAQLPPDQHPMTQLSNADRALYHAKGNGRNQVCSYEDLLNKGDIESDDAPPRSEFWE